MAIKSKSMEFQQSRVNRSINVAAIPALAKTAKDFGVTVVWTCGGMGEFYTLTVSERKAINEAWVSAAKEHNLYVIAHVGTTVQADAIELAAHAATIGADAIASVPPYYSTPGSIEQLIQFLKPIASAGNGLPMYYYHIPGSTGYDIKMMDLLEQASSELQSLLGIKYVDADTLDWMNIVNAYNSSHVLMFAPEPKLQSFGIGIGRGTILAEDFYAPTYLRMHRAFVTNHHEEARQEQFWKYSIMNVFSKYGGGLAERAIYKRLAGVDLGPRRPPTDSFDPKVYPQLEQELEKLGFFNQTWP
eukprot:TRINITY_DN11890_c0_g2_i1.p1 TRINITY_DN11890_c0_g2~~TRINITY_DN11890_c0_g2_i1.p1  ORF type:complete len:302 (+),score=65.96 TRINITY_DN11890_c0_g2_i1:180-1085(+)